MAVVTLTQDGISYPSYVSLQEANTIVLANTLRRESWQDATDEVKIGLLISARYTIDSLTFKGIRSDPNQATEWPRNNVEVNGVTEPNNFIPGAVDEAQALLASTYLIDPSHADIPNPASQELKSIKTGLSTIQWKSGEEVYQDTRPIRDNLVVNLLTPYLSVPIDHILPQPQHQGEAELIATSTTPIAVGGGRKVASRDATDIYRGDQYGSNLYGY